MSECNYCKWRRMKRTGKYKIANAQERKKAWQAEESFIAAFGGGVVVIEKDTGKCASWFMALPKQCCC